MVSVDTMVRFVPSVMDSGTFTPKERRAAMLSGNIVYVNYAHKYFTAEYEYRGKKYLESFRFADLGKAVEVCGGV